MDLIGNPSDKDFQLKNEQNKFPQVESMPDPNQTPIQAQFYSQDYAMGQDNQYGTGEQHLSVEGQGAPSDFGSETQFFVNSGQPNAINSDNEFHSRDGFGEEEETKQAKLQGSPSPVTTYLATNRPGLRQGYQSPLDKFIAQQAEIYTKNRHDQHVNVDPIEPAETLTNPVT